MCEAEDIAPWPCDVRTPRLIAESCPTAISYITKL